MSELKPCPFCGSTEVDLAAGDDVGLSLKITCGHCMGSGPRDFKTQGAHANWNHRPLEDHLRARVRELELLLTEVRDACNSEPVMNGRKYVDLGIRVNSALSQGGPR